MERFKSSIHHFEISFTSECMKSSGNFHIVQDEPLVVGPKGHNLPGIVCASWNWPVINCGALFLTLLDGTLADFDTKVSYLSSFKLTLCRIDGEVVVLEDCKNPGRILPEFFEGVNCNEYVVHVDKDMSCGDKHL